MRDGTSSYSGHVRGTVYCRLCAALILCLVGGMISPMDSDAYFYIQNKEFGEENPGSRAGDPIMMNGGYYYFDLPFMNLGGLIPLEVRLKHNSGASLNVTNADHGNFRGFEHFMEAWTVGTTKRARFYLADSFRQVAFISYNGAPYGMEIGSQTIYSLAETGATDAEGYFYLADLKSGLVYIFEKAAAKRIKWVLDRNGNRLTYEYNNTSYSTRATDIYENAGSPDDRRLQITLTSGRMTKIAERLYNSQTSQWEDGRTVLSTYGNTCYTGINATFGALCAVTDPMGQTTGFVHIDSNGINYPVTALTKPKGNVPYSQKYTEVEYGGMSREFRVTEQADAYGNKSLFSYDWLDPITTETRPDSSIVTHGHVSAFMIPTGHTDAAGNSATIIPTAMNKIGTLTDRLGDTTTYTWHAPTGNIASISDAKGQTTQYTYTPQTRTITNPANAETVDFTFYNRTRIDYADGSNEQFVFNAVGDLVTKVDRGGAAWTYTYNSRGQVLTAANPAGGATTYTYNADATIATLADSDTGATTFTYDAYRRVVRITNPDGTFKQTAYNLNDKITSVIDENGNSYVYVYDLNGNLTSMTDPDGKTTQYAYDLMDRLVSSTDRLNKTTVFSYDVLGRKAGSTDPNNIQTAYGYNTRGWRTSVTNGGRQWQTAYDNEGVPSSRTNPLGHTSTMVTDKLGEVLSETNPLGQTTTFTRNAANLVTGITDPLGRTTNFALDSRGLLTGVTTPTVGTTSYSRDSRGLLSGLTDLKGSNWTFGYTGMGKLLSSTDPLTRTDQYAYDTRGRLLTTTFPDTSTMTNTYDPASNVTRKLYSAGPDLQFAYNVSNLLIAANGLGLTRDDEGRITSTDNGGDLFDATYDDGGRLLTASYNSGDFTVTYGYDTTSGLLASVTDSLTGTSMTFAYDNAGRLTALGRPNGVNTTLTYDSASRLTRKQDGTIIDLQYTLDAAGKATGVDMTVPLDPATLLEDSTTPLTYDAASQVSSAGYSYDDLGRQTAGPGHVFSWDGASRLTALDAAVLAYNGLGDLVTRAEGGAVTRFYYNKAIALSPPVSEKNDISGVFLRHYVWTPDGRLLYMIDAADGNKVYFYHFDHVGSTLALTNSAGAVTDSYAYTPNGRLLQHNGVNQQPFTFVGMQGVRQEGASGSLYHMRARYYDAVTARFLAKEPVWPEIEKPLRLNPYQYVTMDPVTFVDVTGLGGLTNDLWKYSEENWLHETPISNPPGAYGSTTPDSWIKQYDPFSDILKGLQEMDKLGSREMGSCGMRRMFERLATDERKQQDFIANYVSNHLDELGNLELVPAQLLAMKVAEALQRAHIRELAIAMFGLGGAQ